MNKHKYNQVWKLDSIFQDGSNSIQLHKHLQDIEEGLELVNKKLNVTTILNLEDADDILNVLIEIGNMKLKLSEATSFVICLLAQNPIDQQASVIQGAISNLSNEYTNTLTKFQAILATTPLPSWLEILEADILTEFKFILTEWRYEAESPLSAKEKAILSNLSTDAYHAWGQMYQTLMGNLEVELIVDGNSQKYSIGQALNLRSHPDETVRKIAHESLELKWMEHKEAFAKILNHVAGFRLQMYHLQGIDDILQEPLRKNRMNKHTFEAMWSVIKKHKQPFVQYLNRKAQMNQDEKMQSYNFWAPFTSKMKKIDYDEAIDLVKQHVSKLGPQLEAFVTRAITEGWIEAENRPKKAAGAFCAGFPMSGESRVFMTYDGTFMNVLTLVHELGHAFHNSAMNGLPGLNKQYPLSIAETASTFNEMILIDAAIENAVTINEKISLLDEKLKRSVMNFMNIHSRFLFEQNFYEERKNGIVSTERLNDLMLEAIAFGYEESMDNVSAYTWLWTPHFYITNAPFYNFPYVFGYLLALSLVEKAKEMGADFENTYIQLLRDSGKMSTEELLLKHFNEDISQEAFWEKGMKLCVRDVKYFLELTALESER
ncbi:M3 family oligoendopeptidase [Caryophanon tenue]|uniref:Pantothenate kinase n=1 Tax=Caryophanon tenue TaxID=33978 RepID=A0A1C0YCJ0_9BACL|nr:M3 family oligoendopeptidase [Caryophanon tenue]OCS84892.1 pantothenate kinase [Caryophanon tenue]